MRLLVHSFKMDVVYVNTIEHFRLQLFIVFMHIKGFKRVQINRVLVVCLVFKHSFNGWNAFEEIYFAACLIW